MNANADFRIPWIQPVLPAGTEQKYIDGLSGNVAEVLAIHDNLLVRANALASSREFTGEGKRKQLTQLGTEAEASLQGITAKTYLGNIESLLKKMRTTLREPTDREERRFAEIRAHLLTLTDHERDAAYRAAIQGGDEETARAVDLAPRILIDRLVHPDVRREMEQARLANQFPKEFEELQLFETLRHSLLDAVQASRASLQDAGVIFSNSHSIRAA